MILFYTLQIFWLLNKKKLWYFKKKIYFVGLLAIGWHVKSSVKPGEFFIFILLLSTYFLNRMCWFWDPIFMFRTIFFKCASISIYISVSISISISIPLSISISTSLYIFISIHMYINSLFLLHIHNPLMAPLEAIMANHWGKSSASQTTYNAKS